ncbi:MAG: hypothetical protein QM756_38175 [Polyangiaceae bacterium]
MATVRVLGVYVLVLACTLLLSAWRLNELTLGTAARQAWLPFLRPLLAAGFEVSVLVALPAAVLAARAAGFGRVGCVAAFAALAALSVFGAVRFDPSGDAPGQLAEGLLRGARENCEQSAEHRADVPLLGMSWTCKPNQAARLRGRVPMGKRAEFSAASIDLAPDLRTIWLADFELALGATLKRGEIHVNVARAVIRGLAPWGRPADVPLQRRLWRACLAALASCVAGALLVERRRLRLLLAAALGVLCGAAGFALQRWLDRAAGPGPLYFAFVLVGPLALGLIAAAWFAIERLLRRSPVAR